MLSWSFDLFTHLVPEFRTRLERWMNDVQMFSLLLFKNGRSVRRLMDSGDR